MIIMNRRILFIDNKNGIRVINKEALNDQQKQTLHIPKSGKSLKSRSTNIVDMEASWFFQKVQ